MPAGDGRAVHGRGQLDQASQTTCDNSVHSGVMSYVEQPSSDNTSLDHNHALIADRILL